MRAIRDRVGPHVKIMPAVKADGYGHGAVQVSRAALEAGADMLGVATLEEAIELREADIAAPILIFGCVPEITARELMRWGISAAVCDLESAAALSEAAVEAASGSPVLSSPARYEKGGSRGRRVAVHIKVDTGMGRIGMTPQEWEAAAGRLFSLPGIRVEGIFTHFPSSDEPDQTFTKEQIATFGGLCDRLKARGFSIPLRHAANSGGILAHPDSFFDMVRPGIMLYGCYPSPEAARSIPITPALSLKSRIVFLKDVPPGATVSYGRTFKAARRTRVATIPIGYADGYNRHLSNQGEAIVRGRVVPVIGRVCMDQTMLDVAVVCRGSILGESS